MPPRHINVQSVTAKVIVVGNEGVGASISTDTNMGTIGIVAANSKAVTVRGGRDVDLLHVNRNLRGKKFGRTVGAPFLGALETA